MKEYTLEDYDEIKRHLNKSNEELRELNAVLATRVEESKRSYEYMVMPIWKRLSIFFGSTRKNISGNAA